MAMPLCLHLHNLLSIKPVNMILWMGSTRIICSCGQCGHAWPPKKLQANLHRNYHPPCLTSTCATILWMHGPRHNFCRPWEQGCQSMVTMPVQGNVGSGVAPVINTTIPTTLQSTWNKLELAFHKVVFEDGVVKV